MSDTLRVFLLDRAGGTTTLAFSIRSDASLSELESFGDALSALTRAQITKVTREVVAFDGSYAMGDADTYDRVRYRVASLWTGSVQTQTEFSAPIASAIEPDGALDMADTAVAFYHERLAVILERVDSGVAPVVAGGQLLSSSSGASEILRAAESVTSGAADMDWWPDHGADLATRAE